MFMKIKKKEDTHIFFSEIIKIYFRNNTIIYFQNVCILIIKHISFVDIDEDIFKALAGDESLEEDRLAWLIFNENKIASKRRSSNL